MTKLTVLKNIAGHNTGDTINTTPGAARILTASGHAEEQAEKKPRAKAKTADEQAGGGYSPSDSSKTAG